MYFSAILYDETKNICFAMSCINNVIFYINVMNIYRDKKEYIYSLFPNIKVWVTKVYDI